MLSWKLLVRFYCELKISVYLIKYKTRKCLIYLCWCIIIIIIHFRGLQLLIVPVIAGLLEVDINFSSNFETFFEQATSIVNKSIVTVFDACHCKLLKVYCDPMDRWVCATKYVYVNIGCVLYVYVISEFIEKLVWYFGKCFNFKVLWENLMAF